MNNLPRDPHTVHIDGDLLVFNVCAAVEYGNEPQDVDFNSTAKSIESKILGIKNSLNAEKVVVHFSGKRENYRYVVNDRYKANRKDTWETSDGNIFLNKEEAEAYQLKLGKGEIKHSPKAWRPYHLKNGIAYVTAKFDTIRVDGLEADDTLKIAQKNDGSTCIATLDKDLLQALGSHFRWETPTVGEKRLYVKGLGELWLEMKGDFDNPKHLKSLENARKTTPYIVPVQTGASNVKKEVKGFGPIWFLYQCLIGDPTDGIMGAGKRVRKMYKSGAKAGQYRYERDGVGSIEAYQILQYCKTYREGVKVVFQAYRDVFGEGAMDELIKAGRQVFMVNKLHEDRYALMWHPISEKKEWFDLQENRLCTSDENKVINGG